MDDDWDNETPVANSNTASGFGGVADGGKSFSRGRGFVAKQKPEDDWQNANRHFGGTFNDNAGGGEGDTWGDAEEKPYNSGRGQGRGGGRGGRGRGGGRGGGGRGGGGGGKSYNSGGWGDNQEENGGGGGGGGDWGGNNDNGNDWGHDNGDGGENGGRSGGGRGRGRGGGFRGGRGGRGGGGRDRDSGEGGGFGSKADGEEGDDADKKPKEIYVPPEPTNDESEMFHGITTGINFAKYDDIAVHVSGENCPKPITSFETAGLRPLVLENVQKSGYKKPTPIQKNSIPIIMAGRDLMACAQTGSGKTAAFLLPVINMLLEQKIELVSDGSTAQPQVVIVSPTRELTIQIYEQARKFAHNSVIRTVVAYGGTSTNYQRGQVQNGCHILVATPGRLNDFVKRGHVSFGSVKYFVLDEADRMLDMGFLPNVEEMLENSSMVPTGERQTLMFSATFPEEIQKLAGRFLHDYIFVTVGIVGGACTDVEQVFYEVDKFKKRNKLLEILREAGDDRTLVFVETKRNADFLASYLSENNVNSTSIHGDRLQREREIALRDFKMGRRNILVATGVAARGLDIENVKHVINFDLPKSIDEYVHRIGRTGRVGNRGKATSFYDSSIDSALAGDLTRILKQADQPIPDWLKSGGGSYSAGAGFGGVDVRGDDFGQTQTDEPLEEW